GRGSRHAPETVETAPQFTQVSRKATSASEAEIDRNPRARSARLRVATRTDAPPAPLDRRAIGMPQLGGRR
ncbi:MAG: 16S rRNA (cytosine(1402)-N(4))-methyltransferase, partial [Roseovarius sp.]|nr:16S rRNA (cytosine(1402)-N(4))-methyltransferase [Roseovarius sp.]